MRPRGEPTTAISVNLKDSILQKINEKCPKVNRSLLINNTFSYILEQEDHFILDFCKKQS